MNDNLDTILDSTPKKKSSGTKIIVCIVLIILVISLMAYVAINVFFARPKTYFINTINTLYEKSRSLTIDGDTRYLNEPVMYSGEMSINSNLADISQFNNYKLKYKIGMDYKNKKALLEGVLNDTQKDVIDISSLIDDKAMYLKSNTLFEEILMNNEATFNDFLQAETEISDEDFDYILKILKDSIINSFADNDFTQEKVKINLDGKDTNVYKMSYIYNQEKIQKIVSNMKSAILNDTKAMSIVAKMSGVSEDELKTILNEEYTPTNSNALIINLYTKGNKVVKYELVDNNNSDNNMSMTVKDNVYNIIYSISTNVISINIKNSDDKVEIAYSYTVNSEEIIGGSINIETTKESNDKSTSKMIIQINVNNNGEKESIEITNNVTEEYVDNLEIFDTSNAVDYNTLSDSFYTELYNNLNTALLGTPFESITNSYNNSYSNSYNNSYSNSYDNYDYYYNNDYSSYYDYSM